MNRLITRPCLVVLASLLILTPPLLSQENFPLPPEKEESFASWFNALGERETEQLFNDGEAQFKQGKWDKGALIFGRLAKLSPTKNQEAHLRVVQCHYYRGDGERAVSWAKSATERFPSSAKAHKLLGDSYGLLAEVKKQIKAYEKCLELGPDDPEVHLQLAIAYDKVDKPNKTVEHAQRAVQLDASYKKRLQPIIKNSNVARRIGNIITDVLRETETSQLTDEQIDEYARRVGEILGQEPYKENLRNPHQSPATNFRKAFKRLKLRKDNVFRPLRKSAKTENKEKK